MLEATGTVKIADFGVSRTLKPGKRCFDHCGTPAYIAPEIIQETRGYTGTSCDMWSAGCCLYAMVVGNVPFVGTTADDLYELILKGKYDFSFPTVRHQNSLPKDKKAGDLFSYNLKDLVSKLLTREPHLRITAEQALKHPWLQDTDLQMDIFTEKEKKII